MTTISQQAMDFFVEGYNNFSEAVNRFNEEAFRAIDISYIHIYAAHSPEKLSAIENEFYRTVHRVDVLGKDAVRLMESVEERRQLWVGCCSDNALAAPMLERDVAILKERFEGGLARVEDVRKNCFPKAIGASATILGIRRFQEEFNEAGFSACRDLQIEGSSLEPLQRIVQKGNEKLKEIDALITELNAIFAGDKQGGVSLNTVTNVLKVKEDIKSTLEYFSSRIEDEIRSRPLELARHEEGARHALERHEEEVRCALGSETLGANETDEGSSLVPASIRRPWDIDVGIVGQRRASTRRSLPPPPPRDDELQRRIEAPSHLFSLTTPRVLPSTELSIDDTAAQETTKNPRAESFLASLERLLVPQTARGSGSKAAGNHPMHDLFNKELDRKFKEFVYAQIGRREESNQGKSEADLESYGRAHFTDDIGLVIDICRASQEFMKGDCFKK